MDELRKALNTLEIGHLEGSVSRETIEKARSQVGTYSNTYQNRKLGRVGQKYKEGDKKEEVSEKRESDKKESSKSTKIKDATDHIIEEKGKITIDTLDPDTEEKKFKEGDKIKFGDKTGIVGKEIEDGIHEVILDKKESSSLPKELNSFLDKFPDNARTWKDATGEVGQLHSDIIARYNDENPKNAVKVKSITITPGASNKYHKEGILEYFPKLSPESQKQILKDKSDWFK